MEGGHHLPWVVIAPASQDIRLEGSRFGVLILPFPSNHLPLDLRYGQELLKWKKWPYAFLAIK